MAEPVTPSRYATRQLPDGQALTGNRWGARTIIDGHTANQAGRAAAKAGLSRSAWLRARILTVLAGRCGYTDPARRSAPAPPAPLLDYPGNARVAVSVSLTIVEHDLLAGVAQADGISVADLLRDIIDHALKEAP